MQKISFATVPAAAEPGSPVTPVAIPVPPSCEPLCAPQSICGFLAGAETNQMASVTRKSKPVFTL